MEQKRPRSHEKEVVSGGSGVHRRGDGLGTGPVGSQDGYAGKTPSGGHGKRLIGVISHVADLKDAIPSQIRITKDSAGSKIAVIR